MWELDYKESWVLKNWCFWTVVLEKTPESPLDCKEIQPVHPKGDQSWVFIRRTDVEAETTILWPPDVMSWLIGKDPDGGKDWGQEKWTTKDEMVGWYHWLSGHEFEWTLGVCDGQGGLACCFMGLQRVRHDWVTELNWPEPYSHKLSLNFITEALMNASNTKATTTTRLHLQIGIYFINEQLKVMWTLIIMPSSWINGVKWNN